MIELQYAAEKYMLSHFDTIQECDRQTSRRTDRQTELLYQLKIPPSILHWIMSFLTDRTKRVKFADYLSSFRPINKGIVQGSGIGPSLYIVMESDLKALSAINILFKYADDTNLFVPEKKLMYSCRPNLKIFSSGLQIIL